MAQQPKKSTKKPPKKSEAPAPETASAVIPPEVSTSGSEEGELKPQGTEAMASAPSSASPPEPTPAQQKQIDDLFAETRKAVESILGGNTTEAALGAPSGNVEERQEKVQRDHLPGTRRKDKTLVPERIYDDRNGETRRVLDFDRFRYTMIPQDDFTSYLGNGWKFCHYDGGSRSGLLGDGWQGTGDGVFFRDVRGYCTRGDVYLMYTEVANYKEIIAEDEVAMERHTKSPVGDFADVAYGMGVRAYAQVNGEDIL